MRFERLLKVILDEGDVDLTRVIKGGIDLIQHSMPILNALLRERARERERERRGEGGGDEATKFW